jgi:PAS domain S-box-containing protein
VRGNRVDNAGPERADLRYGARAPTMDTPGESPADELTRLRACVAGAGSILALRAPAAGGEPAEFLGALLDSLLQALDLAFAWGSWSDSEGGTRIQVVRLAPALQGKVHVREISEAIASTMGDSGPKATAQRAVSVGERKLSVAFAEMGLGGELVVLAGGSDRPDYPRHTERVLLDVAANQATTNLFQVRRVAAQQRLASDLAHDVMDHIPAAIALRSPDGALEFVNRETREYFGRSLEKLKDWANGDGIHPDDRQRTVERFQRAIASGQPFDNEQRHLRHDGVHRWFQVRGLPLRDAAGRVRRWCFLHTDIDERKNAEEALRKGERESRLIVDSIPGFVAAFTPSGEVDFLNRQILNYFGKSLEELRSWGSDESIHPDDRKRVVDVFARSMASGEPYEVELRARRFDGVYRWFHSRGFPLRDANGQIVRWYNLLTDVEDRKRVEVELKRAYDSFADGQRLSRTGNITADIVADNHIWSEECYRLFEFDPATRISVQMVRDLIHPEDLPTFDARFQQSLEGADFDLVFRIETAGGTEKYVHAVGRLVERVAGRPLFIGALRDVTENRLAEEALNRARSELAHVSRVTSLSMLTASITHEVNQPLSGVLVNAGTCLMMLEAEPPNLDGAREIARRTLRDGKRAVEVVGRLRALFSKREFTLEPLDLNEATREVLALSLSELQRNRVVVQSDLADDLPRVTGDRVQLQQVIINLLRNASDAMAGIDERPRKLSIRTEREDGDHVRLTVRDAGVGIDSEQRERLFEAFHTTKRGGMGIGLSVSRSIVERHHGRLWAEPNDGPGATFAFSIPCSPPETELQTST